jgi:conjugative transfer region protein TrbK
MMSFRTVICGVAYVVLATALLATAIALNNRQYRPASTLEPAPSFAEDDFDAELARCKALRTEPANDADCRAVWQASRERFLNGKKLYQDRAPGSPSPPSDTEEPAGGRPSSDNDRAGQPQ